MVYQEPQRDASTPTVDYEQLWTDFRAAVRAARESDPEAVISLGTLDEMLSGMHDTAQFDATASVRERLASL